MVNKDKIIFFCFLLLANHWQADTVAQNRATVFNKDMTGDSHNAMANATLRGLRSTLRMTDSDSEQYKKKQMTDTTGLDLEEVIVLGKSNVQVVRESAYNVVAIDTKLLNNSTQDIAHALDRVSGVKIRETGGTGSSTQINLNGFSGRHVKVFIDNMPIEAYGTVFQLGNIPAGMAERVEIYKGVVPVELGTDALGGAVHIVTKQTKSKYLNVAASAGSFGTYKLNTNFAFVSKHGLMIQGNAFANVAKNNYKVKTNLLNLETNSYSNELQWFERFHDHYQNMSATVKIGVANKPYADKLLVGITAATEDADIQHANLMKIVYGGKARSANSLIPTVNYEKRNLFTPNLNLHVAANYSNSLNKNTDSLARQYNWKGEYRTKGSKGEGAFTLGEFTNVRYYFTTKLAYKFNDVHSATVNNVYETYTRQTSDAAANDLTSTADAYMPRSNAKNVTGVAYKLDPHSKLSVLAFAKTYIVHVTGPVDTSSTTTAQYATQQRDFSTAGYGAALTVLPAKDWQIKASAEKAYRLPNERELFGDAVMETGDATLKPENSININLNGTYSKAINKQHSVYVDAGLVYRNTKDYIRRQIEQRYGGAYYTNHGQVRNIGVDAEVRYFFKQTFNVGANFSYQDIRNMKRLSATGQTLIYYMDRMPNLPFLFGNADANLSIKNFVHKTDKVTVGYSLNFVEKFYRNWQAEGGDINIPRQLAHDIHVSYTILNGKYAANIEIRNVTNELLYDNYSLQKPGRAFNVSFRATIF